MGNRAPHHINSWRSFGDNTMHDEQTIKELQQKLNCSRPRAIQLLDATEGMTLQDIEQPKVDVALSIEDMIADLQKGGQ